MEFKMMNFLDFLIGFFHTMGLVIAITKQNWSETCWIISSVVWWMMYLKEENE